MIFLSPPFLAISGLLSLWKIASPEASNILKNKQKNSLAHLSSYLEH